MGLVGGGVGRGGAGGGPGCDVVVDAQLLVKLTFLSKTTKKSPLSPHRTLPRFKHSSSDDRRSKTSLLRFPLIICDALSSGMDVLAGHQSMFDFLGLLQIQVEWETKLYGDEW